ncbi:MAG TPA: hypothetical protein VJ785_04465, partial [Anaerolineales bacterium]|nr:hypothetical protein [Anaerolineales bacterium]
MRGRSGSVAIATRKPRASAHSTREAASALCCVSELREFDEAMVLETYGVPASRYAEFAILRGDPSD